MAVANLSGSWRVVEPCAGSQGSTTRLRHLSYPLLRPSPLPPRESWGGTAMPGPIPPAQRTRPAVRDLLRTDRVVPVPVGAREQHGLGIARAADARRRCAVPSRGGRARGAVRGVEPPPGLPRHDQPERAGLGGDPQGGHRVAGGARFPARAPGQRARRRRGGGGVGRGPGLRATGGLLRAGLRRAAARVQPAGGGGYRRRRRGVPGIDPQRRDRRYPPRARRRGVGAGPVATREGGPMARPAGEVAPITGGTTGRGPARARLFARGGARATAAGRDAANGGAPRAGRGCRGVALRRICAQRRALRWPHQPVARSLTHPKQYLGR